MASIIRFLKIKDPYGCFSNFSKHSIVVDGIEYKTTEHYYQSKKFLDKKNEMDVVNASTPKLAAEIGRDRSRPMRPDWDSIKDGVMYEALRHKVIQNPIVRDVLLSTGDDVIVEANPTDNYWAEGDGKGRNMLGILWMKLRDELKAGMKTSAKE